MRQRGVRGITDSILAQNAPFVTLTSHLCLQLARLLRSQYIAGLSRKHICKPRVVANVHFW